MTRFVAVQLSLHFYVGVCTRCTLTGCHIHVTKEGRGTLKTYPRGGRCLNICMMYSVVVGDGEGVGGGGGCRNIVTYCVTIFVGLLSAGRANLKW